MKGDKNAFKLISAYLKQISAEATELIADDDTPGRFITKGEAVARLMFKMALGYTERSTDDKGVDTVLIHKPNPSMIGLIIERMEGRVPMTTVDPSKQTIADRVSEQGKDRIARISGIKSEDSQT